LGATRGRSLCGRLCGAALAEAVRWADISAFLF